MNVIALANGKEYANIGMMKALTRLNPDKLFLIDNDPKLLPKFPVLSEKCVQHYDNVQVHNLDYSDTIDCDQLIPLDTPLLESFQPYMLTAIKMLERTSEYDLPFEKRIDVILTHLRYWNTVIERQKIDLYMGFDVPHGGYNYIIYALCKIKGRSTIFTYNCPSMGYSYSMDTLEEHCPHVKVAYDRLLLQYSNAPIEDIKLEKAFEDEFVKQLGKDADKTPYYMSDNTLPDSYENFKNSKQRFKAILNDLSAVTGMILSPRNFSARFKAFCFYRDTNKYYENWNSLLKPLALGSERYIYFPLHYQPEATTTPQGGCFTWQYLAVELLNSVLPKDVYIYVKENPKQSITSRSMDFPSRLAALSQVKLVPTSTDTYQLMHHSLAVATVTGTAIWEGLFKGKPAIMFGDYITQYAPGVFRVSTSEECFAAVSKILSCDCSPTKKALKIFSKAMEETCTFGFIDRAPLLEVYGEEKSSDGMCNVFLDGFKKYLKLEV